MSTGISSLIQQVVLPSNNSFSVFNVCVECVCMCVCVPSSGMNGNVSNGRNKYLYKFDKIWFWSFDHLHRFDHWFDINWFLFYVYFCIVKKKMPLLKIHPQIETQRENNVTK